ncbi:tRNA 5-methylaminomethyl-2-thiouridinebiosynthesis bifunctional protein MnmC [Striga asiatica]|uniref:tRNA 5-methylaminomethyl-2-thiouridinebiosynthesis bifunctional protein MnmC n=1 Tax=Striga asiatica TaxID=4170 RepID=A0A5A7QUJ9_STRAF|nr:tRNA 5-methylaminomethyl-2-thiouridinebiosynthesis bifunctional protein MnmC [Striga asiatica]
MIGQVNVLSGFLIASRNRSGGSICSGVSRRGVAQSGFIIISFASYTFFFTLLFREMEEGELPNPPQALPEDPFFSGAGLAGKKKKKLTEITSEGPIINKE